MITSNTEQIFKIIDKNKSALILLSRNYNGDAISSALALSLYLKKYLNIDKVIKDKRLQEIDFGSFTGQKRAFLREKYSQFFEERSNDKYHVKFPNGESYYDGEKRVVSLADELRQKNEDTLIVLHSMIFRPLIKSLLHLSIEEVLTTEFPFELTYIIDIGKLEIFYYKNGEIINGLYQET